MCVCVCVCACVSVCKCSLKSSGPYPERIAKADDFFETGLV